jgi:hypothetical protein
VTGTVLYFVADSASSDEQATDSALQPWITGGKIGVSGTF